jgi:hypothetical protein
MEQGDKVSVFLRPRRFGKSTNLSMLKSFFSLESKSKDFDRFLIGKEKDFVQTHCGAYPVVFLSIKGVRGDTWEDMLRDIWVCLRDVILYDWDVLPSSDIIAMGMDSNTPDESIAAGFLKRLTRCLFKNFQKQVIVLIDEYDAPLNHAYRKQFHDRAFEFFGKFFSNALKSNPALNMACLMGIVELRGPGMLSGLNNLIVYSSADEKFSEFFGFTTTEITKFLPDDKDELSEIIGWYNGYFMGCHQMINPWSFMRYYLSKKIKSYWVHTANTETIQSLLHPVLSLELIKVLVEMHQGVKHKIGTLSTVVDYASKIDLYSILCLLVHTGYLTFYAEEVFMPNEEIKYEWRNCGFGVASPLILSSTFQQDLLKSVNAASFDITSLQNLMKEMLRYCSYLDTVCENSYHMYYYGIFVAVCGAHAMSNREAGDGRYDIGIALGGSKRLLIFEFKHSKELRNLQRDAMRGLDQILAKKYYDIVLYSGWTCYAIGVSFHGKYMSDLECKQVIIL